MLVYKPVTPKSFSDEHRAATRRPRLWHAYIGVLTILVVDNLWLWGMQLAADLVFPVRDSGGAYLRYRRQSRDLQVAKGSGGDFPTIFFVKNDHGPFDYRLRNLAGQVLRPTFAQQCQASG